MDGDSLPLGLPEISDLKAKQLSEAGRAALAARPSPDPVPVKPPPPTQQELRAWLRIYCQAWVDLQTYERTEVELHHFDLNRSVSFDLAWLPALEQQIEYLQLALGMSLPPRKRSLDAGARRKWA